MLRAYKYRIYPTGSQKKKIDHSLAVCRLVYNLALDVKIYAYKTQRVSLTAFDLCYQLVELKEEFRWIGEVDSQALLASVKKVDVAFDNFYKGAGYPKFKSKNGKQSFQCPNNTRRVDFEKGTLTIPKIKGIPIALSRRFTGNVKTVTISKTPTGKYFASILVDTDCAEKPLRPVEESKTIGIDTGIKSYVVTSDGKEFEPNRKLKDNLKRLKCLQRRTSRKKKGGNNWKKANMKVALLHEKIANSRLDYIHKVTHELTGDSQAVSTIVIEDLNVSGIVKNHKLAQAISDVSFGKFYDVLGYKCKWRGINLIRIDRFAPSSKRCSTCGEIKQTLSLSEREWTCESCNTLHDRDLNAAVNIKYYGLQTILNNKQPEGIRGWPVEPLALAGAMKQEKYIGVN